MIASASFPFSIIKNDNFKEINLRFPDLRFLNQLTSKEKINKLTENNISIIEYITTAVNC